MPSLTIALEISHGSWEKRSAYLQSVWLWAYSLSLGGGMVCSRPQESRLWQRMASNLCNNLCSNSHIPSSNTPGWISIKVISKLNKQVHPSKMLSTFLRTNLGLISLKAPIKPKNSSRHTINSSNNNLIKDSRSSLCLIHRRCACQRSSSWTII